MKKLDKIRAFAAAAAIASLCMTCPAFAEVNSAEGSLVQITTANAGVEAEEGKPVMTAPAFTGADIAEGKPVQISPAYNPDSGESPTPVENAGQSYYSTLPYGTGSVENITQYWTENGYPDYVSYAAKTGFASYEPSTQTETVYNIWTVGLVGAGEAQKQEILSLVSSKYQVIFEEAEHSYAFREETAEKIMKSYPNAVAELSEASENIYLYNNGYTDEEWQKIIEGYENGIVVNGGSYDILDGSVGVPEIGVGAPEIGELDGSNPPDVAMKSTNAPTDAAAYEGEGVDGAPTVGISQYSQKSEEDGAMNTVAAAVTGADADKAAAVGTNAMQEASMIPMTVKKADPIYMWIFICGTAIIIAAVSAFVIIRRAKKNAAVTDTGKTVTLGSAPTKAEIVKAVRESEIEPDEEDFRKIMDKIEKE